MVRSIHKVSRELARKQLAGRDIRSKLKSECLYNSWPEDRMRKLIKEYYEIELYKRSWNQ
ncbi:hypothetical protein CN926_00675 [Bacillus thuringiensis]|nr:hypothetical protein CN926_00675 [Bacillus thuringiensis]